MLCLNMKKKNKSIEIQGTVWMTVDGQSFGGHGRVDLLAGIAEHGSITRAAKSLKMSYKSAWGAIDTMNNLAGEPLVERLTGGKGGGGTKLTRRGEQLVVNFKAIQQEHVRFIEHLGRQARGIADNFLLIRRMNLKTSARNNFFGRVRKIRRGAVNDEVELEVVGGIKIISVITCESTKELNLRAGAEAFALIKSSQIILVTDDRGAKFSARNRLKGVVSRVQTGAVNTEVIVDLPGGGTVAAVVTKESSKTLGLKKGKKVMAIFKASSVTLGVYP